MFYISSTIWILSITSLLVILTKKRFEVVLPFSFICGTLILYLFGFINKISLGYYLTWIIAIGTMIYVIYKTIKDKEFIKDLKDKYITIGLFVFIILLIYVFLLYRYQGFTYCDEFMHWGPMVKETFRLDGFYAQTSSFLDVHKDYPPFFSLLETLFCFFGGEYCESHLYVGLITFMFSLFMPLFRKLEIKNKIDYLKAFLMLIGIILIGLTISRTDTASDYANVYNSIYVDWVLAVFTAFTFYLIFIEKEWNLLSAIQIGLCFVSLILMKQMGLPFYLLALLFTVIKLIFIDKKNIAIKYLVLFIMIPIIVYFSWNFIKEIYNISGQFNIDGISIKEFRSILSGNLSEELMYKHDVISYFKNELLQRPLFLYPIKLSYFFVVLIQIVLMIVIQRKKGILVSVIYGFGSIAYAFTMLLLYVFLFSIEEAIALASFDRYMISYLYIGNCLLLMLAYEKIEKWWGYGIAVLATLLFVEPKSINTVIPKTQIENNIDSKVLMIEQFWTGAEIKDRSNFNGLKYQIDKCEYINEGETEEEKEINKKQLIDKIKQYDYLFILAYDDPFYHLFSEISGIEDLHNNTLYKVIVNKDGSLTFENMKKGFADYVVHYYVFGTIHESMTGIME